MQQSVKKIFGGVMAKMSKTSKVSYREQVKNQNLCNWQEKDNDKDENEDEDKSKHMKKLIDEDNKQGEV